MQRAQGFAQQGAQVVWTAGHASATYVQETAPFAMILVYVTGTTTLATIFGDNNTPPTPLANPFTANDNGYWYFYAADGRYDVMIEAENWTWTIGDIMLGDQSASEWITDVQANGNSLLGASLVQTNCLQLGGASNAMSVCLDANSGNMVWYNPAGIQTMYLDANGNLHVNGCVDAGCYRVSGYQIFPPFGPAAVDGNILVADSSNPTGMSWQAEHPTLLTPWGVNIDAANHSLSNASAIGIGGATVPPFSLAIQTSTGNQSIYVKNTSPQANVGMIFVNDQNQELVMGVGGSTANAPRGGNGYIDAEANALIIQVQGEELMRFVYPGYFVGIVKMNPQFTLDVSGDINCTGQYRVNGVPVPLGLDMRAAQTALEARVAALEAKVK